jgi:hypothetical protein
VIIAVISWLYNVLVAVSCAYSPDDPLSIGVTIQFYACAGSVLSILGLAGIATVSTYHYHHHHFLRNRHEECVHLTNLAHLQKNYALTLSFALFLLVDAFVSAIVRLLVLQYFFRAFYDHNVCTASYDATRSPRNLRHDIVTSVRYQEEHIWPASHQKTCRIAVGATQVAVVGVLICFTIAQGSLAMTVRRFAKRLVRKEDERLEKRRPLTGSMNEK